MEVGIKILVVTNTLYPLIVIFILIFGTTYIKFSFKILIFYLCIDYTINFWLAAFDTLRKTWVILVLNILNFIFYIFDNLKKNCEYPQVPFKFVGKLKTNIHAYMK